MKIEVTELEKDTKIKIKRPGPGERGEWVILGRVPNSGIEDPAYDVMHVRNGRRRIFRRSRMTVRRGT